jgi:hypothetical protein
MHRPKARTRNKKHFPVSKCRFVTLRRAKEQGSIAYIFTIFYIVFAPQNATHASILIYPAAKIGHPKNYQAPSLTP